MPRKDPSSRASYQSDYFQRTKEQRREKQRQYMADLYRERREWVRSFKQERCCDRCGFDDHRALEFHHRDPSQKLFAVCTGMSGRNWQSVLDEIAKCDLLCANCHAIEHYDRAVGAGRPRASDGSEAPAIVSTPTLF